MLKNCIVCNTQFETSHGKKTICSLDCKTINRRKIANEWNKANPEKLKQIRKTTQLKRVASGDSKKYQQARRATKDGYADRFMGRIKAHNPTTDVSREYLLSIFGDQCAVTNVPFQFIRNGKNSFENPYAPSIDRIDSKLPYQVDNIQVVLSAINFAKNAMSMKDFTNVWRDITKSWAALTKGEY